MDSWIASSGKVECNDLIREGSIQHAGKGSTAWPDGGRDEALNEFFEEPEEKEAPEWVKKLHLEPLYEKLVRQQSVKKDVQARIFRKKVVQYNNKSDEKVRNDVEKLFEDE